MRNLKRGLITLAASAAVLVPAASAGATANTYQYHNWKVCTGGVVVCVPYLTAGAALAACPQVGNINVLSTGTTQTYTAACTANSTVYAW